MLFSQHAAVEWSQASAELMQNGAFRFSTMLERIGKSRNSHEPSQRQSVGEIRRKSATLVFVAGIVGTLAVSTNASLTIGVNLFTAQFIVAVTALLAAWQTNVHRRWAPN
jgi:hypothetical protein